jgi:nanoRNase/pAp phosphatase (c-di-AMP/oligoRNAs hydrolase)
LYNTLKDKKILQYSHGDLDGIFSIVLSEYFIRPVAKELKYLCTDYEKIEDDIDLDLIKNFDYIFFTDISVKKELFKKLKEINPNIYIFDHHLSAWENLQEQENYFYTDKKCGTKIFFEWLTQGVRIKPIISQAVNLVDTYDLYKKKDKLFKAAKYLNYTLYNTAAFYKKDPSEKFRSFIFNQIKKFDAFFEYKFTNFELKKIKEEEIKEKKAYEEARKKLKFRKDGNGDIYLYTESRTKVSAIASRLLDENPHAKYIAVYVTYEPKAFKISLRSSKYEVKNLAEKWGGGGHPFAASFNFADKKDFINFINGRQHLA